MMKVFHSACDPWGITVERVEVGIEVSLTLIKCFIQVKNLSVAREMVKSMAVEAHASRVANGLLIMQKGEGKSLEKIK